MIAGRVLGEHQVEVLELAPFLRMASVHLDAVSRAGELVLRSRRQGGVLGAHDAEHLHSPSGAAPGGARKREAAPARQLARIYCRIAHGAAHAVDPADGPAAAREKVI